MEILTKEWNSYIESMKSALTENKEWQEELDSCLAMAEDAKNGDEGKIFDCMCDIRIRSHKLYNETHRFHSYLNKECPSWKRCCQS